MKAIRGNILFKIDTKQKEKYDLGDGKTLIWERGYEFNLRIDRCSLGFCLEGEGIPDGAPIVVHHLSSEESYLVPYSESLLTSDEVKQGYKVFAIPQDMCYAFRLNDEWIPCKNFLISLRIFKKYSGVMQGIDHQLIKNRLYIVSGVDEYDGEVTDLSGQVCIVTENSDYEIIFHTPENKEGRLIRTRGREIMGLDGGMTEDVKKGKLMIGYATKDCKTLIPISNDSKKIKRPARKLA